MKKCIIVSALLLSTVYGADAEQEYWPQWRGPTRDGVLPAKGLAMTTLPDQPSVLWKIKSGEGLASPVVANGSVFHFENRNGNETMVALSIADAWFRHGQQEVSVAFNPPDEQQLLVAQTIGKQLLIQLA